MVLAVGQKARTSACATVSIGYLRQGSKFLMSTFGAEMLSTSGAVGVVRGAWGFPVITAPAASLLFMRTILWATLALLASPVFVGVR
jgi:hypothetical protein